MLPATPQPFAEALAAARARGLLPTDLSSEELALELQADVRRRSVLSARTTETAYVEEVGAMVDQLLSPEGRPPGEGINEATARARLQDSLDRLGYTPEAGFPSQPGAVPPAEAGGIRDLASDRRIKLLLETQVRQMAAIGYRLQGDTPAARDAFPCLELVRIYPRRERRNWPLRWGRAGGALYGPGLTRMVARKDDAVWNRLGSAELFPDGLGQPFPPFAWKSGMGVRQVPREDAVALGVIAEDETPEPVETDVAGERDPNLGTATADDLDAALAELDAALPGGRKMGNRSVLTDQVAVTRMLANRLVAEAFCLANAGTSLGAHKGWITRHGGAAAVAHLHDEALSGTSKRTLEIGPVSTAAAAKAKAAGQSIAGFRSVLESDAVRHAMREHGNAGRERARGQEPLTREDFELLPAVLERPDHVRAGKPDKDPNVKTLEFEKRVNGRLLVVEQVRRGRSTLAFKTMWKRK